MSSKRSLFKRKSFYLVIVLIVILFILAQFSFATNNVSDSVDIKKISKYPDGTTIYAGDEIIDNSKVNKFPIVTNLGFLVSQIKEKDFIGSLFSISTGAVPAPAKEFVLGNVTEEGLAANFDGPGYIEFKNNKIFVHAPGDFVWGYTDPYIQAIRTEDGIDLINLRTNETVKHIAGSDISNDTIDEDYVSSGDAIKEWYDKYSVVGSKYNLQYCVAGINDGRKYIEPEKLKEEFPTQYKYSKKYPGGSPVLLYKCKCKEVVVASSYTYLGDHSEYGNDNREYNAKEFVKGWNGTIIPANATGCGRDGIGFTAVKDEEAEGGSATHGVCPSARALRNAVMALGIPLPVGMDSGEDAVLFGYSPTTGIKITNTYDYPIKLIMWTEGSGTGMAIYCNVVALVPQ
ncbi:MAG: hypothetical protein Q4P14_04830 [Methanobacteriaceae archaeon]|nr:hypothetical protein [Methanobacteriaceae archaeon]